MSKLTKVESHIYKHCISAKTKAYSYDHNTTKVTQNTKKVMREPQETHSIHDQLTLTPHT